MGSILQSYPFDVRLHAHASTHATSLMWVKISTHHFLLILPAGYKTGFEFGQRYKYNKSLEHRKCKNLLQTDRSFVFSFLFILDKCALKEALFLGTAFFE